MANARIQLRRGTAPYWTDSNPVLRSGEPGFETDTGKLKFGDGVTPWRELEYFKAQIQWDALPTEEDPSTLGLIMAHIDDDEPHLVYDDGPSLSLIYQNVKV